MECIVCEATELTHRQARRQIDDRPFGCRTRYLTNDRDIGIDQETAAVATRARDLW
jgi:hypothetical protein